MPTETLHLELTERTRWMQHMSHLTPALLSGATRRLPRQSGEWDEIKNKHKENEKTDSDKVAGTL